jgi:hypothetical protein
MFSFIYHAERLANCSLSILAASVEQLLFSRLSLARAINNKK